MRGQPGPPWWAHGAGGGLKALGAAGAQVGRGPGLPGAGQGAVADLCGGPCSCPQQCLLGSHGRSPAVLSPRPCQEGAWGPRSPQMPLCPGRRKAGSWPGRGPGGSASGSRGPLSPAQGWSQLRSVTWCEGHRDSAWELAPGQGRSLTSPLLSSGAPGEGTRWERPWGTPGLGTLHQCGKERALPPWQAGFHAATLGTLPGPWLPREQ